MVPYFYDPRYTRLRNFHSFSACSTPGYIVSDIALETIHSLLDLVKEKKLPVPDHISESSFGFILEWENTDFDVMLELNQKGSMRFVGFIENEEMGDQVVNIKNLLDLFHGTKENLT